MTADLLSEAVKGGSSPGALVAEHYIRFTSSSSETSSISTGGKKREFLKITPNTPLEDLEQFFNEGQPFAVVTDEGRRFVLGVAVQEDLEKFVKSRPSLKV